MQKLSLLIATTAIVLAGCGGQDEAAAPQTIDQDAQETAVEAEAVITESRTAGSVDTAAADAEQVPAAAATEPDLAQGKKIYGKHCFACHGSGAAGAPKLGDTENWAPRIAKGLDTLAQNAIGGYKGAAGYMPPKGGFMSLDDADVTAAVAYMVDESR